ncbi:ShlB/FhaC/HecB family hemolysin secretion/activation protein [Sphingomonas sp. M1-B02]|uniref:ShlB/FhaC/HecB family hemolysin secretion/activation protein n=1 Tax=Sphingomonas sp. M1-B02 TaxID=3114300 RepID=UPI00223F06BE|nr:ShlB/FhaC/HecB family hemolysin secretion/activation protein [Sphingomonas sp. S6-11]UZK67754.1 hypothetical protein OKW87_07980 [Sphingomonas sp. S6-11]
MATPAVGQQVLDRVDPAAIARERLPLENSAPPPKLRVEVEAPAAPVATVGPPVLVGAVLVHGLRVLTPGDFADIVTTRIGRTLDPEQLAELASAVGARARERGLAFSSAWIEPQALANGILTISIDEGQIDEIQIDGPKQPAVEAALKPLVTGRPARISEVERRLLIAGDIDGVLVTGSRYVREGGRGILVVRLLTDRLSARIVATNDGSRPIGPAQMRIDVDMNALFASDDAFTVTYSTTPLQPNELQYARARYSKRISRDGTEIALVGSSSLAHPGAYIGYLDIRSRSWFAGIEMLQPLARRRAASLWMQGALGVRDIAQRRRGDLVRHDRIVAARISLYGASRFAGGRLRVNATVSRGLGILGASEFGDSLSSRRDAGASFTTLSAWTDWTRSLGGDFSMRLAVQSQLSSKPLFFAEEIGIGGTAFVRGYDWSERSGDQGAMGSVEFRYDWAKPFRLLRNLQLYGYFDGGEVTNLADGYGDGSLASGGGGFRADISRKMDANLEVAVPLSGPRYDTDDRSPKINVRLIRTF